MSKKKRIQRDSEEARDNYGNSDLHFVNRLCNLYVSKRKYAETARLMDVVQDTHHAELQKLQQDDGTDQAGGTGWEMPLDLVVKYGIAQLYLGDEGAAARCFQHLISETDVDGYGDLFQEVAEAYASLGNIFF